VQFVEAITIPIGYGHSCRVLHNLIHKRVEIHSSVRNDPQRKAIVFKFRERKTPVEVE
jgi:hypothetical protein